MVFFETILSHIFIFSLSKDSLDNLNFNQLTFTLNCSETNLKTYRAPAVTAKMTEDDIRSLKGTLEAEPPNVDLYDFTGTLRIDGQEDTPLYKENLLLRVKDLHA